MAKNLMTLLLALSVLLAAFAPGAVRATARSLNGLGSDPVMEGGGSQNMLGATTQIVYLSTCETFEVPTPPAPEPKCCPCCGPLRVDGLHFPGCHGCTKACCVGTNAQPVADEPVLHDQFTDTWSEAAYYGDFTKSWNGEAPGAVSSHLNPELWSSPGWQGSPQCAYFPDGNYFCASLAAGTYQAGSGTNVGSGYNKYHGFEYCYRDSGRQLYATSRYACYAQVYCTHTLAAEVV